MRPTTSFPAPEPIMPVVPALRLAEAGKNKRKLGRSYKLAEQAMCA